MEQKRKIFFSKTFWIMRRKFQDQDKDKVNGRKKNLLNTRTNGKIDKWKMTNGQMKNVLAKLFI